MRRELSYKMWQLSSLHSCKLHETLPALSVSDNQSHTFGYGRTARNILNGGHLYCMRDFLRFLWTAHSFYNRGIVNEK